MIESHYPKYRCPRCGWRGVWRSGNHPDFEREMRCNKCENTWDPDDVKVIRPLKPICPFSQKDEDRLVKDFARIGLILGYEATLMNKGALLVAPRGRIEVFEILDRIQDIVVPGRLQHLSRDEDKSEKDMKGDGPAAV